LFATILTNAKDSTKFISVSFTALWAHHYILKKQPFAIPTTNILLTKGIIVPEPFSHRLLCMKMWNFRIKKEKDHKEMIQTMYKFIQLCELDEF
jgi:hypothetical protein